MDIPILQLSVVGLCNQNCDLCTTKVLRDRFGSNQLSLEQLAVIIDNLKAKNIFVRKLLINSPGEPTLWRHMEEGIKMIRNAGICKLISVSSNGLLLQKIEPIVDLVHEIMITIHPPFKHEDKVIEFAKKHNKVKICKALNKFNPIPFGESAPLHDGCFAVAPAIVIDEVNILCGGTYYAAAKHAAALDKPYVPMTLPLDSDWHLQLGKAQGMQEICKYCSNNIMNSSFREYVVERKKLGFTHPYFKKVGDYQ